MPTPLSDAKQIGTELGADPNHRGSAALARAFIGPTPQEERASESAIHVHGKQMYQIGLQQGMVRLLGVLVAGDAMDPHLAQALMDRLPIDRGAKLADVLAGAPKTRPIYPEDADNDEREEAEDLEGDAQQTQAVYQGDAGSKVVKVEVAK